jgi:hypothetical protein
MPPRLRGIDLVAQFRSGISKRPVCIKSALLSSSSRAIAINKLLSDPKPDEHVTVNGWVRSVRKQKRVSFAEIDDGSTVNGLQAVLRPEQAKESVVFRHSTLFLFSADEHLLSTA